MVKIKIRYEGDLHCELTHGPSGTAIHTDAPKDNMGRGESFSPTDLVASALGSCILTTMGIFAQKKGWQLGACEAEVIKEMVMEPARRIGKLTVTIKMPKTIPADQREVLERVANTCPVTKSLHESVEIPMRFEYV